jgi:hypothetical protein
VKLPSCVFVCVSGVLQQAEGSWQTLFFMSWSSEQRVLGPTWSFHKTDALPLYSFMPVLLNALAPTMRCLPVQLLTGHLFSSCAFACLLNHPRLFGGVTSGEGKLTQGPPVHPSPVVLLSPLTFVTAHFCHHHCCHHSRTPTVMGNCTASLPSSMRFDVPI